jgi:hypothetical protein
VIPDHLREQRRGLYRHYLPPRLGTFCKCGIIARFRPSFREILIRDY